jgi:hypothetical protein
VADEPKGEEGTATFARTLPTAAPPAPRWLVTTDQPALPGQALNARVAFFICPEAGQEGVAEAHKMWRGAGGDQDNYDADGLFIYLHFDEDVTVAQVASLTKGLLGP